MVDCHLLRDVTGTDDKFDSSLLITSHAPEGFPRPVFTEKAEKRRKRTEAWKHFFKPLVISWFANTPLTKANYMAGLKKYKQGARSIGADGPD